MDLRTDCVARQRPTACNALYLGRAHYKAAETADRWHRAIGLCSAVLSAIVGTAIFATIRESAGETWRIVAGLVLLLASLLASIQSFFGFAERASDHRVAGGAYAVLRRDLDLFLLSFAHLPRETNTLLDALIEHKGRLDELGTTSPLIPKRSYTKAEREFEQEAKRGDRTSVAQVYRNDSSD